MDTGLALTIGLLCGAGAAFLAWRTIVAVRTGCIWLRGQKATRDGEPTWFWMYLVCYVAMLASMFYGIGIVIAR